MSSPMLPRHRGPASKTGLMAFEAIPPLLRPLLRAYLLGYASAVAPRLLTLMLQCFTRRRRRDTREQSQRTSFVESVRNVILTGFDWQRFPTFCAVLVGGSTLLEAPLRRLFDRTANNLSQVARTRLSRWFSSFIAAYLSILLLQSKRSEAFEQIVPVKSDAPPGVAAKTIKYAGRTLDLSLFAATRAIDVIVGELWFQRRARRVAAQKWTASEEFVSKLTDTSVFAISCAFIMWSWIYDPHRLPRSYNKWITSAASVDQRLIQALQRCRLGTLRYGKDTGQAPLLQSMCADYEWPLVWGDPAKSIPFPCEIVHMGCGPSCEFHAISRFYRSFWWSMATYLPLNLALALRKPNVKGLVLAILSASQSSAFLGTFITLFYYGVCLGRTRVGPHIIGKDAASRDIIDGGVCAGTGCFLCGWSVLIEKASRRKDMALFVAPRAMATLLPRRYALGNQWRESLVFAASTAVVFTCVLENRSRVRGVLGNVLGTVLEK